MAELDNDAGGAAPEASIRWFREARFGLFVHWGPVSLEGTEIGWSRGGERRHLQVPRAPGPIPADRYDRLYERFNPTAFDAAVWAELARDAGMRYVVFTSKHHDGFVNFDSQLTDYKITDSRSPFGRDIVRELTEGVRAAGLRMGYYYSQPDWHHPAFFRQHDRYLEYLHGQVEELCTRYGEIAILWFDGLRHPAEDWDGARLLRRIRELQPGILINDRCGLPGDFDTPEQRVGSYQVDRPWESCITICEQWAWKPGDRMKSLDECIAALCRCAAGDGNLLLNVGPTPEGRIEARQAARLREIGAWLADKGDSIYGTRGGPVLSGGTATTTHRGSTVYVHLITPGERRVRLAGITGRIESAGLLGSGPGAVDCQWRDGDLVVTVTGADSDEVAPVVRLDLDRQVSLRPGPWSPLGRQRSGT